MTAATTTATTEAWTPPLTTLYVYLTQGCNLACRHCWLAPKLDLDGSKYPTLDVGLLETALQQGKELGLTTVKLTGGEPLLHPRFLEVLELIRSEELKLMVETNGTRCTPELARAVASFPSPFVSVSLDGADAATHDGVRGIAGAFAQAKDGIRNLVAAGAPPQIIMTVMRCNVDHLEPMIRLAQELGATSLKFNVVQPTARGDKLQQAEQTLSVSELIALATRVTSQLATTTTLRLHFDVPPAFRPMSTVCSDQGCAVCGIVGILGVIPTGHYALCGIGEHVPELVFGKIGDDPLAVVWKEHAKLQELRHGLPGRLEGVCSRCLMKHRCLGSCLAQNYYRTGSFWQPFWFCEEAERQGLFPLSRTTSLSPAEAASRPRPDAAGARAGLAAPPA